MNTTFTIIVLAVLLVIVLPKLIQFAVELWHELANFLDLNPDNWPEDDDNTDDNNDK